MNQPLRRHFVDHGNRRAECIFNGLCITAVDRHANVAQRTAQSSAELAVVLAAFDVLTVRFERGIVTGHCGSILETLRHSGTGRECELKPM
jgi:hypothetical protein